MTLLGDDSISVIVHSLALITALCLNEDLGNKVCHKGDRKFHITIFVNFFVNLLSISVHRIFNQMYCFAAICRERGRDLHVSDKHAELRRSGYQAVLSKPTH